MQKIHWYKEHEAPSLMDGLLLKEAVSTQRLSNLHVRDDVQSVEGEARKFVVIIDDSPTVRKIIETCLGREDIEVMGFPDGVEAMCWFARQDAHVPDLVILDIGLPKMDGYEVARRIKSKTQFKNTIVIVLSKHDGCVDKLKGRLAGAKAYLTKPFKMQELTAVVQMYLGITIYKGA